MPAPTHGTEIPFFLGGNECFEDISDVTEAEQALADYQNDWFVSWIKSPSVSPGWDKVTPKSGTLAKLGVPGNELAIELAKTDDYNGRCQSVSQFHELALGRSPADLFLGVQPISTQLPHRPRCDWSMKHDQR